MNAVSFQDLAVLIIDDEEDFANALASRLELRGMQVECAFDGERGLNALKRNVPDVVLLDMRMPGLSGLGVLHAVRRDPKFSAINGLPVIIVSGHAEEHDVTEAEFLGISGFVEKPVDFDSLLETMAIAAAR